MLGLNRVISGLYWDNGNKMETTILHRVIFGYLLGFALHFSLCTTGFLLCKNVVVWVELMRAGRPLP